MLIVVCGEDIASARSYYNSLIEEYKKKGNAISELTVSDVPSLISDNAATLDLFGAAHVYICKGLSSAYKGRTKTPMKRAIEDAAASLTIVILDWEEGKSAYELTLFKKVASTFHEAKLHLSIFQLLDTCTPGNAKGFITSLRIILKTQEEMFVYTLLWRHIRKLVLAADGVFDAKTAPWQKGKIAAQSKLWNKTKLLGFYEGLIQIDERMKTSEAIFNIQESLELLSSLYL